ncbi:flavoprotein [Opitutus terrae]|uniref:Phosphopantothenoylcysteine decarboxylase n=1 Tax=Opitutus terrae (strain DSM 11246 / JCM 15787 / PB90-1) TaxID=452637 RepID=B1ZVH3_OPITP|nr:flavoprotein [Opitutus terrae]ACB74070.1 Phosphopantothenoylcysteine decarboxylase [Opitutus terrae PB90-1]
MPNVLVLLTGSIACFKACTLISRLVQAGVTVQTVATPAALRFVGTATLEGLSGRPVFTDVFEEGRALDHIALARAADLALVCPATANTINQLAAGIAGDPVGTLFLAWELESKPWWIAPAMNAWMWKHPATAASIATLKSWGVRVLDPVEGPHACGETGPGRLAEPELITAEILKTLGARPPSAASEM